MVFWIFAAALTFAVALMVLWPLYRKNGEAFAPLSDEIEHDIAVYRDQLNELAQEEKRGVISAADAGQARAEVGRRLLAAEERRNAIMSNKAGDGGNWAKTFLVSVAFVFVPVLSLIIYSGLGSPGMEAQPLAPRIAAMEAQQEANETAQSNMVALVERAEGHLKANPNDGRGWDVLAPIYLRMGRFDDAINAFTNAIRLTGDSAQRYAGLGEALYAKAQGVVVPAAADAFRMAAKLDETNPQARFFLALGSAQNGEIARAQAAWQALSDDAEADQQWRGAADEGLRLLATGDPAKIPGSTAELQARAPQPSMPKLDQETIANAQAMSSEDQSAMIKSMVARLDARLKENPKDAEGWMRLIRAYVVLDQRADAANALDSALEVFGDDGKTAADLRSFAQSLNLAVPGADG